VRIPDLKSRVRRLERLPGNCETAADKYLLRRVEAARKRVAENRESETKADKK